VGDEKLPSVTTILGQTQSVEKRESLAKWIAKKGKNEAERVKNEAAKRGSSMHSYLEHYLNGEGLLDLTEGGVQAKRMAEVIRNKGFKDLEEIWGSEVVLSYPGLYAGQTDLVGVYQGRESIIDFKQSNKPKREEWIEDYYYQGVAYATAHDFIYGTRIEQCVIMMFWLLVSTNLQLRTGIEWRGTGEIRSKRLLIWLNCTHMTHKNVEKI
jgi:genome maintenance exonuclease 1